ncbi:electron transfer flavoprotein subunit beta/FixA family protein [Ignisphaera sp. 4213-co]|uniref:Electron transfer flavoprotein subunit beta/FixA family protein n=1 Tax=Ignisphaera cupida TaxID=3050454 RepID=A0ABD4Z6N7_9CREN|nr:electron transfer flavoprotein subunit beta/FixA family protein [Ignisphaera sp. 4213-co]MDK6028607.1 electron transfer flavoprotein subunit beta/FixA family protein [Ignisphaera sp. 4213-co]
MERGTVDRTSTTLEINPFDLYAIEVAKRIKKLFGGIITAISMAPPHAENALRDAIARGVDRAILLSDKRFAGADTLATSYTLASAIKKLGHFNLILCGEKSVDGDTAHVGPEVAEFLGIPHVSFVTRIVDVGNNKIVVESDYGDAYYKVEVNTPALIALSRPVVFMNEFIEPSMPRISDVLRARRAKIEIWNADYLSDIADTSRFGLSGSPTRVVKAYYALEKGREPKIVKGEEGTTLILKTLKELGVV